MRNIFFAALAALALSGCGNKESLEISISNPVDIERNGEMVEIPVKQVYEQLKLTDDATFVILDDAANEVPYQITYDNKVVFPVTIAAGENLNYTIQKGTPATVTAVVYGRQYPERMDDLTWENDRAAYRAYGPALQELGEKAYGYDVFTKSVSELVVEDRYAKELDPVLRPKIRQLRKEGKMKEAREIEVGISYHIDHGNGMDAYAVGPTLGGGVAALYPDSKIVYPYCYKEYEILDNGPLRFTAKLTFTPLTVKDNDKVVETRVIQLDKGSHLNKTTITYSSLTERTPIVAGLVMHAAHPDRYAYDAKAGYIAYADPTTNVEAGNGIIYVGAVFPGIMKDAKVELFDKPAGDAIGHVLGVAEYVPESEFVYYWGSGWSKAGIESDEAWNNYLKNYAQSVRNPLQVTVK